MNDIRVQSVTLSTLLYLIDIGELRVIFDTSFLKHVLRSVNLKNLQAAKNWHNTLVWKSVNIMGLTISLGRRFGDC